MKRIPNRPLILIIVALTAPLACSTFPRSTGQTATPSHVAPSNPSPKAIEIPTVSYCDLIRNPNRYDDKVVRVNAHYRVGFETSYIYELECVKDKPPAEKVPAQQETWLSFDHAYETCWRPELAKVHEARGRRGARAEVTVVGKFYGPENRHEPIPDGKYQFIVQCLERVKITAYDSRLVGDDQLTP